MGWWLSEKKDQIKTSWMKRFDARFWTVNFPRPMMASVITTHVNTLRVDAVFYKADDLAGLIWETEDTLNHPLLAYETDGDYRGCVLRFRWRSQGIRGLDAVDGPTLTIEGRDALGNPKSWYVRLWNYAVGTAENAVITLDFNQLFSGFTLPDEGEEVYAGAVDRLFISLVPHGYGPSDEPLPEPVTAWVELAEVECAGPGSTIKIGDALLPEHNVRMANGYDDVYNVTPERIIYNLVNTGYRGLINHYVGMSHYFNMNWNGAEEKFIVTDSESVLNRPCISWHRDFISKAYSYGYEIIFSLSYELFDAHTPEGWKQRSFDGKPALTGWSPPSTLLSPANDEAMAYLQKVAAAFVRLAAEAGVRPLFQIGEPWWWVPHDGQPYIYDAAARAVFAQNDIQIVDIATVKATLDNTQKALLDKAGELLGQSTIALRNAAQAAGNNVQTLLLFYAPQVLDRSTPELHRANMPAAWSYPAFDILQLEDYDFVIAGDVGSSASAFETVSATLGYRATDQHYFSGFVLDAADRSLWAEIANAALVAEKRGAQDVFFWAYSQIIRDGFVYFHEQETEVESFHDVLFPLDIGKDATVTPGFSTTVVSSASGYEQRNAAWHDARLSYDAGVGVRSEADIVQLTAFFRARRGAAIGFRFRDPIDDSSSLPGDNRTAQDQILGQGDGVKTRYALVKRYGLSSDPQMRRITRPIAGTVLLSIDGEPLGPAEWTLAPGGWVNLKTPPRAGSVVAAGFKFDVPVRFLEDQLHISIPTFRAGEAPRVPLVEIREA